MMNGHLMNPVLMLIPPIYVYVPDPLSPLKLGLQARHTVGGHRVQVDLVLPDVHGCHVTVREGHVEVSVGHDVITRITRDKQWRNNFCDKIWSFRSDTTCVCFMSAGHIVVTDMSSERKFEKWMWELYIVYTLIDLLNPFEGLSPASPLPVRDRTLAKCSSRPEHSLSSTDLDDCHTDAYIKVDELSCAMINKDTFFRNVQASYPGLEFLCHTDQSILELHGGCDAVTKATKYILNYGSSLSEDVIQLTEVETMMMEKTDAQNWFRQSLDTEGICCIWELTPSETGNKKPKMLRMITSRTDAQSNITTLKLALESCFQTSEVMLGNNQIPGLQSDSWKQFLDDLQRPRGDKIAPVLKVEQGKIVICDVASNLSLTHRATLDSVGRCVTDSHPELYEQKVTETVTKLQPWQVKFLTTAQVTGQLPEVLQKTMTVNLDMTTVHIHAPLHSVNKYIIVLWNYIADFSQQVIPLTAASTQVLRTTDSRKRVQTVLDGEGVACDWHVDQGQLVISAHQNCMQQVKNVFMSEIGTTECFRQRQDQRQQTEVNSARIVHRQHQVDDQLRQSTEQQTDDIHRKNVHSQTEIKQEKKEVQREIRQGENEVRTEFRQKENDLMTDVRPETKEAEVQTEDSSIKTEEKLTQTCMGFYQSEEVHTTVNQVQRKEAQSQIGDQTEETSVSAKKIQNREQINAEQREVDVENRVNPNQSREEIQQSQADITDTQGTRRHRQTEEEGSDTDAPPPHQGMPQGSDTDAPPPHQGIPQGSDTDAPPPHQGMPQGSDTDAPPPHQGIPQGRPQLSPTQRTHPPSHELTTHSLPRHNPQSPSAHREAFTDQREPENAPVADSSSTFPKYVVSSQADRTEVPADSTTSSWDPHREVSLTQPTEDQPMPVPSWPSACPHTPPLLQARELPLTQTPSSLESPDDLTTRDPQYHASWTTPYSLR
ncbi:hypothetical protein ACOMHN_030329 [Nucella lapillus]